MALGLPKDERACMSDGGTANGPNSVYASPKSDVYFCFFYLWGRL